MDASVTSAIVFVAAGIVIGFVAAAKMISRPIFAEGRIGGRINGKYDRWAVGLTVQNFSTLLWAIGEYSCRAGLMFDVLDGEPTVPNAREQYSFRRARLALLTIAKIGRGETVELSSFIDDIRALKVEST